MAGIPGGTAAGGDEPAASALALFLIKPRAQATRAAWLAGMLALATFITALRLQLGLGTSGVPLVFYLPAILAVTLIAGWEYGVAALVLSIATVWYIFIPPPFSFGLSQPQSVTMALWSFVCVLLVWTAHSLRLSLQAALRNEMRYRRLIAVISDMVWVTDGSGRVREAHPAWTRVTGQAWPDYRGLRWADAVHEEDRAKLMPDPSADNHLADFRLRDPSGDWRWYRGRAVALRAPDGEIVEWITAVRDVHESKLARERDEIVIGEARHRLKNLVTIIDALAKNSRRRGAEPNAELEAYLKRFLGRLHALGAAADLVLAGQHQYVEIGAVIRSSLAPFIEENAERFRLGGPDITLSEATGGSLALAIHELATNAIKYGALTTQEGVVSIDWKIEGDRVTIEWKERGGPAPVPPAREGFGGRVIKSVPAREKNGEVVVEYPPDGLYCRISFTKVPGLSEAG
ncbi:MAG TPA: HWE histidine kinase domain-containing protein [Rhizomicrobium sp.]